jgi:hypothetical protein
MAAMLVKYGIGEKTRANLIDAVTAYDYAIRQRHARNPRVYHNPFALSLYMEAVDRVTHSMAYDGHTLTQALTENFTDHMLDYLLRKVAR